MGLYSRNFITSVLLVIPILLGLIFSPFLFIQNIQAQTDTATTSLSVIPLSFTIDSTDVDLGDVFPGEPVTTTNTITVTTNDPSGFNIKVKRNDADTTMDLEDDQSVNIPDRNAWNPAVGGGDGNATFWQSSDRHFGFRVQQSGTDADNYNSDWWGDNDTDDNAKFAGFPDSSKTIVNRTSNPLGDTDSVVLYKLDIPNTQPTGIYSGGITYSATVNL